MDRKTFPLKTTIFFVWILLILGAVLWHLQSGFSFNQYSEILTHSLKNSGRITPIVFISIYIIRGFVFFPATILTIASGALFGPFYGIMYTFIGENISANASFLIGRYFGIENIPETQDKKRSLASLRRILEKNGFFGVLLMRLLFFPFDLVGYVSGASGVKQRDFALGTLIGVIPGLFAFVFLGGSTGNKHYLIAAGAFFLAGILLSEYLKNKHSLARKIASLKE